MPFLFIGTGPMALLLIVLTFVIAGAAKSIRDKQESGSLKK
jgi:hypothetical protein